MLQAANIDLFNPSVLETHNSEFRTLHKYTFLWKLTQNNPELSQV